MIQLNEGSLAHTPNGGSKIINEKWMRRYKWGEKASEPGREGDELVVRVEREQGVRVGGEAENVRSPRHPQSRHRSTLTVDFCAGRPTSSRSLGDSERAILPPADTGIACDWRLIQSLTAEEEFYTL